MATRSWCFRDPTLANPTHPAKSRPGRTRFALRKMPPPARAILRCSPCADKSLCYGARPVTLRRATGIGPCRVKRQRRSRSDARRPSPGNAPAAANARESRPRLAPPFPGHSSSSTPRPAKHDDAPRRLLATEALHAGPAHRALGPLAQHVPAVALEHRGGIRSRLRAREPLHRGIPGDHGSAAIDHGAPVGPLRAKAGAARRHRAIRSRLARLRTGGQHLGLPGVPDPAGRDSRR